MKTTRTKSCLFCGSTEQLRPTTSMVVLGPTTENNSLCTTCLTSIEDRTPAEWFRWLERNDPQHWQRVVDLHRSGCSDTSDLVRRIRIDLLTKQRLAREAERLAQEAEAKLNGQGGQE